MEAAASLIGGEPLDDKGLENVANRGIALNGKVGVKAAHVGRCPRGGELEVLHKEVGLGHGLVKAFYDLTGTDCKLKKLVRIFV